MATKTIFTCECNIDEVLPDWRSSGFIQAAFPFYCGWVALIRCEVEVSGSGSRFSWRASLCGAAHRAGGGQEEDGGGGRCRERRNNHGGYTERSPARII